MIEKWRDIDGYPDKYQISNLGRVRSLDKIIMKSNGMKYTNSGRMLKPAIDSSGYYRCALSLNKKLTTYKIHRLVAKAFCIGETDERNEVNHMNGDKKNNFYTNLEWCSRSENLKHAYKTGLAVPMRGSNNPTAKIDEIKALTIKTLMLSSWKLKKISNEMGISYHIVKDISRNRTWKHV